MQCLPKESDQRIVRISRLVASPRLLGLAEKAKIPRAFVEVQEKAPRSAGENSSKDRLEGVVLYWT